MANGLLIRDSLGPSVAVVVVAVVVAGAVVVLICANGGWAEMAVVVAGAVVEAVGAGVGVGVGRRSEFLRSIHRSLSETLLCVQALVATAELEDRGEPVARAGAVPGALHSLEAGGVMEEMVARAGQGAMEAGAEAGPQLLSQRPAWVPLS